MALLHTILGGVVLIVVLVLLSRLADQGRALGATLLAIVCLDLAIANGWMVFTIPAAVWQEEPALARVIRRAEAKRAQLPRAESPFPRMYHSIFSDARDSLFAFFAGVEG